MLVPCRRYRRTSSGRGARSLRSNRSSSKKPASTSRPPKKRPCRSTSACGGGGRGAASEGVVEGKQTHGRRSWGVPNSAQLCAEAEHARAQLVPGRPNPSPAAGHLPALALVASSTRSNCTKMRTAWSAGKPGSVTSKIRTLVEGREGECKGFEEGWAFCTLWMCKFQEVQTSESSRHRQSYRHQQ